MGDISFEFSQHLGPVETYAVVAQFMEINQVNVAPIERFRHVYRVEPWTDAVELDLDAGGEVKNTGRIQDLEDSLIIVFACLHARMADLDVVFTFACENGRYEIQRGGTKVVFHPREE